MEAEHGEWSPLEEAWACLKRLPRQIMRDFKAIARNDPAAKNPLETIFVHTPFHAIVAYRFTHILHLLKIPIIPRFISVLFRFWSGVEIHPGAEIGCCFFIDHGTGVVIGETTTIGHNCVVFHNVTFGGTGHHSGKRHPTVGDDVLIGTGATLLGPIMVGDNAKIGAEAVIINRDVPENCTVVGAPGEIVKRDGKPVSESLPEAEYHTNRTVKSSAA
ncbi:MAG: Serine acetyltransferase [Candidatus Marinimicrobia bacterium]|nr:Serine acetyltransferase [Candidatus Neomarinimicrobiota bacterium]